MNKPTQFKNRTFAQTLEAYCRHKGYPLWEDNQVSQHGLARHLGVSQPNVHRWLRSPTTPSQKYIEIVASRLHLTIDQLLGKEPIPEVDGTLGVKSPVGEYHARLRSVPLISSIQAGAWREASDAYHPSDAEEWCETTAKVSSQAFALRVEGRSMHNPNGTPSIPHGSIVIVDPEIAPTNGKIVVAKLVDSNEVTVKKLVVDGPTVYLEPLNTDYKPIQIDNECVIVGVVKQVIQNL